MLVIDVYFLAYSVPSGAPQSLEAMFVQPTEVSLMWREVACVQQNGPITGYFVRYYAIHGTDGDVQQNKSVVTTGVIIDGLTPNTEYAFQVASFNVNGTGPFSGPITLRGKWELQCGTSASISPFGECTVKPPNKGYIGDGPVVPCREVVLFSEVFV